MPENRLNIIQTNASEYLNDQIPSNSRKARERELQAKFERLWLTDPERFNPLRNCLERERLDRTWGLLTKHVNLVNKQTADIACASGVFSRRLRDSGARVEAMDIAENALKLFEMEGSKSIIIRRETMPDTSLPDHHYDVIVCTELIAELPKEDYRLFFAELSRLIKHDGYLICSSAIDIDSEGGLEKLIDLAQTEFDIIDDFSSYHALFIRIKRFFETPARFIEGWKDSSVKMHELSNRRGFNKWWYLMNSSAPLSWFWSLGEPCARPFIHFLRNSRRLMLFFERICRFMSDNNGISHYLFLAKRRPLKSVDPRNIPIERPHRKEIWE